MGTDDPVFTAMHWYRQPIG